MRALIMPLAFAAASLCCTTASAFDLRAYTAVPVATPGTYPSGASVVGDFNGDGQQEVLAQVYGQKLVRISHGARGYSQQQVADCTLTDLLCQGARVGDFNGDRIDDVVMPGSHALNALIGSSTGAFSQRSTALGDDDCIPLATADADRDGRLDLLAYCYRASYSANVEVLFGDGTGGFVAGSPVAPRAQGTEQFVDWDGDGAVDVLSFWNGQLQVYANDGEGRFAPARTYDIKPAGWGVDYGGIAVADFDADGRADVAVLGHTFYRDDVGSLPPDAPTELSIYRQAADGSIALSDRQEFALSQVFPIVGRDIDGNGYPDVLFANRYDGSIDFALNSGGHLGAVRQTAPVGGNAAMGLGRDSFGDVDGDGCPDIALFSDADAGVSIVTGVCDATATQNPSLTFTVDHSRGPGLVIGLHNRSKRSVTFSGVVRIALRPLDARVAPSSSPAGCTVSSPTPGTFAYECPVSGMGNGQAKYFAFAFSGDVKSQTLIDVHAKVDGIGVGADSHPRIDRRVAVLVSARTH